MAQVYLASPLAQLLFLKAVEAIDGYTTVCDSTVPDLQSVTVTAVHWRRASEADYAAC